VRTVEWLQGQPAVASIQEVIVDGLRTGGRRHEKRYNPAGVDTPTVHDRGPAGGALLPQVKLDVLRFRHGAAAAWASVGVASAPSGVRRLQLVVENLAFLPRWLADEVPVSV
jgi:hypothetical protein